MFCGACRRVVSSAFVGGCGRMWKGREHDRIVGVFLLLWGALGESKDRGSIWRCHSSGYIYIPPTILLDI